MQASASSRFIIGLLAFVSVLACSGTRPPLPRIKIYSVALSYDAAQARVGEIVFDGKPYIRVAHPAVTGATRRVGFPALPVDEVFVVLPPDASNVRVAFQIAGTATIARGSRVVPVTPDEPTSASEFPKDGLPLDRSFKREPIVADPRAYASGAAPYPAEVGTLEGVVTRYGARVAALRVSPFVYYPAEQRTELRTSIRAIVTFESASATRGLYPELSVPQRKALIRTVANANAIALPAGATTAASLTATADYVVPDVRPSKHDSVDCVIITRAALTAAFQPLADWKTRKGIDARIVTIEWIETRYAGVDLSNKVRNFILDAKNKWGASWFLLGGDVDLVPARLGVYDNYTSSFGPTDLYFAGHATFWNANGNHVFGEGSESDLYPDVFVGRASVADAAQAAVFVGKVLAYEQNPPAGYGDSALLMGVADNLGSDWVKESNILPLLPPGNVKRMYDQPSGLNPDFVFNQANAIAQVNAGYHVLNHLDHSGINSLGTGSHSGGGAIGLSDADAFTNGIPGSVLWTYGCDPNAFDYDSISEHFMRNANGGTVAFVGNTRTGYTSQSSQDHQFFKAWYVDRLQHIGGVFSTTQSGIFGSYGSAAMHLLGDPSMMLWSAQPSALTLSGLGTIGTGSNVLNLTVSGLGSGEEATVTFRSSNGDLYAGGQTSNGVLAGTLIAHTASPLSVVVTSTDRRPIMLSVPVTTSPAAHLYVSGLQVIDTGGNANGQLEPGENATLRITVTNGGGSPSVAGTAALATTTSGATLSGASQPLGVLAPSGSQTVDFTLALSHGFADGAELLFTFTTSTAVIEVTAVHVPVFAPLLEQTHVWEELSGDGDDVPDPGETLRFGLHVINNGFGDASTVTATLTTTSPAITITDASVAVTTALGKGDIETTDTFDITFGSGFDPNVDTVTLTMTDLLGNSWTQTIKPVVPLPPSNMTYRSNATSITPMWDASTASVDRNYKIYRSIVFNAPVKVERFLVRDASYYEDTTISSTQPTYFYHVSTIDSFGNESPAAMLQTWTSLPTLNGFPRPILPADGTITGHTVAFDVDGDGKKEIFAHTGDPGVLYAWKADGSEFIAGGDPNFAEFAALDGANGGAPAFGDIDNDGDVEIVVNGKSKVFAFEANGTPVAGWSGGFAIPNLCSSAPPALGNTSPALGDLDGDGWLEVITTSFDWVDYACGSRAHVYVIGHNGAMKATYDIPNGNYSYATPALADLNSDGKMEAVIPASTGEIYVLDSGAGTFAPVAAISGAIFRNEVALADLDNDGHLDAIAASQSNDRVYAVRLVNGAPVAGWAGGQPLDAGDHIISQWSYSAAPAVADVDCDGRPEIALGTEQHVYLWEHDGTLKSGWPVLRENKPGFAASAASPLFADMNADGQIDVVMSSSTLLDTGLIYAWNAKTAVAISAFPQALPEMISRTGTVADIDGDGLLEIVQGAGTHMYAFQTGGRALDAFTPWPSIDRNATHTSTLLAADLGAACCTPPPSGLAGWWPFNETAGTIVADLAGGHDGTAVNGPLPLAGMVGGALSFDGATTYVSVPHDPALDLSGGQFTLDFWINPAAGETQGTIFRKGTLAGSNLLLATPGFHLYYNNGHFLGFLGGSIGFQNDFSPFFTDDALPGTWTFVALTIDVQAGVAKLYINDHLANTTSIPNIGSMVNTNPVIVGGADIAPSAARSFAGVLDELELANRVLTLQEVQDIYAAGPAGKCGSVECLGTRTLRIGSGDGYAAFHPDPVGAMFGCNSGGAGDASTNGIRFDPPGPIPESNFNCTSMLYVFDQAGTRRQFLSIHDAPTNNCPCTANPGPAGACFYEPLCPPNDVAHLTCSDVFSDTGVVAASGTQMQRITEFTMPNFPGLVVRLVQDGFKDHLVQRYEFTNTTGNAIQLRLSRVADLDVNYMDDGNGNAIPDPVAYTKNVPDFVPLGAEVHDNLPTPQVHVRITAPSGSDATFEGARLQGNGGSAQGRIWWNYGVPLAELGLYGLDSDYWLTTWTGDPATPSAADQAVVIQSLLTIPAGQTRTYVTETSLQ